MSFKVLSVNNYLDVHIDIINKQDSLFFFHMIKNFKTYTSVFKSILFKIYN